jgi:hypothetical protein
VSTSGVFRDGDLVTPLLQYRDEAGYWYADVDLIYVRYVSDHANFGMDLSRWPSSFVDYVKAYFAGRIIHKLPGAASDRREFLHGPPGRPDKGHIAQALMLAKNKDAMAIPSRNPQSGTWARARHAGVGVHRNDGGNTTSLIG